GQVVEVPDGAAAALRPAGALHGPAPLAHRGGGVVADSLSGADLAEGDEDAIGAHARVGSAAVVHDPAARVEVQVRRGADLERITLVASAREDVVELEQLAGEDEDHVAGRDVGGRVQGEPARALQIGR